MKRLDRPSGYFQTFDPDKGTNIEGETRSCVHCGFTWIYNPMDSFDRKLAGKLERRGTCIKCLGLVCAQPHCLEAGCKPLQQWVEETEAAGRKALLEM